MNRPSFPLSIYLAGAGAFVFISCALLLSLEIYEMPLIGSVHSILSVYSLVIATFMAGVHWGQHLHASGRWPRLLAMSSNVIAIAMWLGFLVLEFKAFLGLCIVAFVVVLFIDLKLHLDQVISRRYTIMRCAVTAVVIMSLAASWAVS